MVHRTVNALASLDWDFHESSRKHDIHSLHPYPAKFIPDVPRQLLEVLRPSHSGRIFDPFCGSGTTLVESMRQGYTSFGVDLNPLSCLISRVKTTPLPAGLDDAAANVIERALRNYRSGDYTVPPIPAVNHWFLEDVQHALASLTTSIKEERSKELRQALQVALSSIIVRVSNQDSNTRYAAIAKDITGLDVFVHFERAAARTARILYEFFDGLGDDSGTATVLQRDIMDVRSSDIPTPVSAIITSPPYPNAYEYWLYHKYRMYWLEMDPIAVREREIGARPHYFKKNAHTPADFERQMSHCFALAGQVIEPMAPVCFLVGRSIIRGQVIDNVALLQRAALPHGFALEECIARKIPARRKSFNPSHSTINEEHIVVFRLGR